MDFPFENLVIEGGGSRAICVAGVLKVLEEYGIIQKIKRISGASAGAIIGGLIAVGYTYNELIKDFFAYNIEDFLDSSIIPFADIHSLVTYYGLYKGDYYQKWYDSLLYKKTKIQNLTFKQLYDLNGTILVIVGTNLTKEEAEYFNYIDNPDMPISLAIRISSSLPGVFRAVNYKDNLYIDGGLIDNYPIWIFDDPKYNIQDINIGDRTLGIKFMSSGNNRNEIKNCIDFSVALITTPSNVLYKQYNGNIKYNERTMCINIGTIKANNFKLDDKTKKWLINEGIQDTIKYLSEYINKLYQNKINV